MTMKVNSIKTLSAIALGLFIQSAHAGNITDIKVSVLPNQQRVIKLQFDENAVEPSGFITATPARIALDFPSTDIKVAQSSLSFNDQLLNQIIAAQGNGHSRVLLGLSKEGQYNTEVKGNEVWVYLSEAESTNSAASAISSPVTKNTTSTVTAPVAFNIDFHKGSANSGVIEYASNYTGQPQIKRQNDRLIITLKNYALSTQDQRNLDVTDFSTPVRTVSAKRIGNDTQITIRNPRYMGI